MTTQTGTSPRTEKSGRHGYGTSSLNGKQQFDRLNLINLHKNKRKIFKKTKQKLKNVRPYPTPIPVRHLAVRINDPRWHDIGGYIVATMNIYAQKHDLRD